MSDLSYNGVTLELVRLNSCTIEPALTEDKTDYLFSRCVLDVTAVLNPAATAYVTGPIASPGTLPPATLVAIRHALEQPRSQLLWTSANPANPDFPYIMLQSPAPGFTTDLNNGPKPLHVSMTNLTGSRTAMIRFVVETSIRECPYGEPANAVLAHRFSQDHDVNDQHLTTITTQGTAYFRTDLLQLLGQSPDKFRAALFGLIPVPAGFFRERIHVQVASAQNALRYTIADRERMYEIGDTQASGSNITKVDMRYGLVTVRPNGDKGPTTGGMSLGHVNVQVWGNKRASNWIMTQRAFALALNKIAGFGQVNKEGKPTGFVQQISIFQVPTDRNVGVSIQYVFAAAGDSPFGPMVVDSLRIDNPIGDFGGINPSPPWGKGTRGTFNEPMLFEALKTACLNPYPPGLSGSDSTYGGSDIDYSATPVETVAPVDLIPSTSNAYSPKATQNATSGSQEMRYRRRPQLFQLPVARPPSSSSGSQTSSSDSTPKTTFVQTAAPTSTLVVNFDVECVGAMPSVPDPRLNDPNLVLLDQDLVISSPVVNVDGATPTYAVIGQYVYGHKDPLALDSNLATGILGWTSLDWAQQALVAAQDYVHGLIDDPNGSTTTGGTAGGNV